MTRKSKIVTGVFTLFCLTFAMLAPAIAQGHHKRHSKKHKIAAAAAPIAVGKVFGPAGSLTYGSIKHRHKLTHGSAGSRAKTAGSVVAPVAASTAFGPAGTVGYLGIKHRHWIGRHLKIHRHHHHHAHH